ncbi:MAG: glycosyltransferase family 39 protein [Candidatus Sulfotelmatobacter sp.]
MLVSKTETNIYYSRWSYVAVAALLALIAVVRVLLSYSHTAQAFDEPYHVAAAIELLDHGRYTLDPLHPPLQRIAIGLPLYATGERFPQLSESHSSTGPYVCAVGNAILNDGGHYTRNLMLARLGVLPFLLLGCVVVFLWTRREYGDLAGVAATALFTTVPIVLEFSGIAYTDMVAAATQAAAFWGFATWLDRRTRRSAIWMGIATGLALLSKFTTFIYLPAATLSVVALRWWVLRLSKTREAPAYKQTAKQGLVAAAISIAMVWAGYGFAVGHVRESMQMTTASMPSFQHFPTPVARIARDLVLSDPEIPAPALIRGVAVAWVEEKMEPTGYLLGHIKSGGWWYFFLVGIIVKTPVPFLILVIAGLFSFRGLARQGRWTAIAPAACAFAVLLVTLPVKINYGVRHVLVVFPLLAIVAGYGCSHIWNSDWNFRGRQNVCRRAALATLLLWQGVSTVRARSDYIAYFNEIAGKDPSKVLVAGCDLDCGQDIFALSRELHQRRVSHASLALWTSADLSKMDLPDFEVPQPDQPVAGWFAISLRTLRAGDLFHTTYPPGAFAWLNPYQPVTQVGKTILLYYIPGRSESKPK